MAVVVQAVKARLVLLVLPQLVAAEVAVEIPHTLLVVTVGLV
jgi:hypothetical protein